MERVVLHAVWVSGAVLLDEQLGVGFANCGSSMFRRSLVARRNTGPVCCLAVATIVAGLEAPYVAWTGV